MIPPPDAWRGTAGLLASVLARATDEPDAWRGTAGLLASVLARATDEPAEVVL